MQSRILRFALALGLSAGGISRSEVAEAKPFDVSTLSAHRAAYLDGLSSYDTIFDLNTLAVSIGFGDGYSGVIGARCGFGFWGGEVAASLGIKGGNGEIEGGLFGLGVWYRFHPLIFRFLSGSRATWFNPHLEVGFGSDIAYPAFSNGLGIDADEQRWSTQLSIGTSIGLGGRGSADALYPTFELVLGGGVSLPTQAVSYGIYSNPESNPNAFNMTIGLSMREFWAKR